MKSLWQKCTILNRIHYEKIAMKCIFYIQGKKQKQKSSLAWDCNVCPILGITHGACFEQLRLVHVTCGASNVFKWWTWVWNKRGRFDYKIKQYWPKIVLLNLLAYIILVPFIHFRMHFCLPFHFCATGCFQYCTAIFWICQSPSGGLAKLMEESYPNS